jgi:hypothetical protein
LTRDNLTDFLWRPTVFSTRSKRVVASYRRRHSEIRTTNVNSISNHGLSRHQQVPIMVADLLERDMEIARSG